MISKLILNFILILFLSSCDQFNNYTEVQVGHTIKVSSTYFDKDDKGLVYAWSPPKSEGGNIPKFDIKDNNLYFTPEEEGKYNINLSVETLGGEMIIKENFNYKAVFQLDVSQKSYIESKPTNQENKNNKLISTYYTVQLCSKTIKEEAEVELSKLKDMGYDDAYMEKFYHNDIVYWRVRAGKFNSMRKAEKRRNEIANILQMDTKDLWTLKVN